MSPLALGLLNVFGVLVVALSLAAGLIWVERRLLALWQDRYGPNRVGPFGLLQVLADMIKIFTKEDWIPPFADRPVFVIAPAVIMVTVLLVARGRAGHARRSASSTSNIGLLVLPRHVLARRLQRGAGRLGLGQQVLAARAACAPRRRC